MLFCIIVTNLCNFNCHYIIDVSKVGLSKTTDCLLSSLFIYLFFWKSVQVFWVHFSNRNCSRVLTRQEYQLHEKSCSSVSIIFFEHIYVKEIDFEYDLLFQNQYFPHTCVPKTYHSWIWFCIHWAMCFGQVLRNEQFPIINANLIIR